MFCSTEIEKALSNAWEKIISNHTGDDCVTCWAGKWTKLCCCIAIDCGRIWCVFLSPTNRALNQMKNILYNVQQHGKTQQDLVILPRNSLLNQTCRKKICIRWLCYNLKLHWWQCFCECSLILDVFIILPWQWLLTVKLEDRNIVTVVIVSDTNQFRHCPGGEALADLRSTLLSI